MTDTVATRILSVREMSKLNQTEVAKILGVSQSNYSRWEKGTELIPLKKLSIFCNYFNVSMDYIIGLTNKKKGNGYHELDPKVLGSNLRKFRKKNNITQVELAEFLNTTHSTISAYESGKTTLLTSFALAIIEKYQVSLDFLCGRTNNFEIKKDIVKI